MNYAINEIKKTIIIYFTVLQDGARVSFALFKKDGSFVGQFMCAEVYKAGPHIYGWDCKDILGEQIIDDDYEIEFDQNNFKVDLIGGAFNSSDSLTEDRHRGGNPIADFTVRNGYITYCNEYDERKGKQFRSPLNGTGRCYSANAFSGDTANAFLVCSDDIANYWIAYNNEDGPEAYAFLYKTDITTNAPINFTNGVISNWKGIAYNSVKLPKKPTINGFTFSAAAIWGPDVQKNGNAFVVPYIDNSVSVIHKTSGNTLQLSVPFDKVLRCVYFDEPGNLWIGFENEVRKYTVGSNGLPTATNVSFYNFTDLQSLAISPDNSYFIVAEGATSQIKGYSLPSGNPIFTHGIAGGYNGNPSVLNRFQFNRQTRLRCNDNGYWLLETANNRLLHYNLAGELQEDQITYLVSLQTCVDKNDATRQFSKMQEALVMPDVPLFYSHSNGMCNRNWSKGDFVAINNVCTYSFGTLALASKSNGVKYLVEMNPLTGLQETGYTLTSNGAELYPDGLHEFGDNLDIGGLSTWYIRTVSKTNGVIVLGDKVIEVQKTKEENDPTFNGDPTNACFGENTNHGVKITLDGAGGYGNGPISKTYHLGGLRMSDAEWAFITAYRTGNLYTGLFPFWSSRYENGNQANNQNNNCASKVRIIGYVGQNFIATWGEFFIIGQRCEYWRDGQVNVYKIFNKHGVYLYSFGKSMVDFHRDGPLGMAGNANCMDVNLIDEDRFLLTHCDESFSNMLFNWMGTGLKTYRTERMAVTLNFAA